MATLYKSILLSILAYLVEKYVKKSTVTIDVLVIDNITAMCKILCDQESAILGSEEVIERTFIYNLATFNLAAITQETGYVHLLKLLSNGERQLMYSRICKLCCEIEIQYGSQVVNELEIRFINTMHKYNNVEVELICKLIKDRPCAWIVPFIQRAWKLC